MDNKSNKEGMMDYPSIDHSFVSPCGHISKRAKKQYLERFANELFGDRSCLIPTCKQPTEKENLLRRAKELRELAERGMKPRAFIKEARVLELKANKL
jgi:hypothetical protein